MDNSYLFLGIARIEPFNKGDVLDTFFFSKINIKKPERKENASYYMTNYLLQKEVFL